ncbi:uncharacterized protein N7511_006953 [Penicillium nucicola]|uniref:uncharacterized protein n=1 Tax=Penicillium nucicola TaxID=1850975 RepID=UPI0025452EED|nr:uncharacterized protein N7511_006953 [Penicillium nucicola]KAJ5758259.1 hypothetical protein N7511_006953 [Penicillium nucicola]
MGFPQTFLKNETGKSEPSFQQDQKPQTPDPDKEAGKEAGNEAENHASRQTGTFSALGHIRS